MNKALLTLIPGLFTRPQGHYFLQYQFIPHLQGDIGRRFDNAMELLKLEAAEKGIHLSIEDRPRRHEGGYLIKWRPEVRVRVKD